MSKAKINYNDMEIHAMNLLENFMKTRILIAEEDVRHKGIIKELTQRLEMIVKNRQNDIDAGISRDEAIRKHSTMEVDNEIRAENEKHKALVKPLNAMLKDTYAFMPEGIYDAYVRKIEDGKRGAFMDSVKVFLVNLGITESSQSAIGKLSERISDFIGVSVSRSKTLLEDGEFTSILKQSQFNKLFMSIFCDILSRDGVF